MTGYAFHPEARIDLDEIHDYIAGDSPDAADSVIGHVLAAIRALIPFPHQGHRRPDLTSRPFALCARPRVSNCLRPGGEALVGSCRYPWPPRSTRDSGVVEE
jgi:plasmid stabilization system protein ParE